MRISAYPRAFSLYPNWLKPVLVSLGAMFVVTALFLMILIWKSAPSSAGEMSTLGAVAPLSITPQAPQAPDHAAIPAQPREVPSVAGSASVRVHKSAKHHKASHHKKRHAKVGRRTKLASKGTKAKDPLLDLLR